MQKQQQAASREEICKRGPVTLTISTASSGMEEKETEGGSEADGATAGLASIARTWGVMS
jgi:hypothetical protein